MKDILIVDGYNVIFAWPELKRLSQDSLEHSRLRLKEYLQNYGHYAGYLVILVFDGKYELEKAEEEIITANFIQVFTGKGITADAYIEREVFEHQGKYTNVYVVTSDGAEQHQILGSGGLRIPAAELRRNILAAKKEEQTYYHSSGYGNVTRNEVASMVDGDVARKLEELRLNKK